MKPPWVMQFEDLPHTEHAHEFVGADHGEVLFSIILVHAVPGAGPRLYPAPLPGGVRGRIGGGQVPARRRHDGRWRRADRGWTGQRPHGFTNTGTGPLRLTAIHGAAAFDAEWLSGPDPVWASKPER